MKNFKKGLTNLIKVKTIVTFVVAGVWAYLALRGAINSTHVQDVFFIVVSFFFGTQYAKRNDRGE